MKEKRPTVLLPLVLMFIQATRSNPIHKNSNIKQMKRPKEPIERNAHRHACKHCTEYSQCLASSGFIPGIGFIEVGCSPNSECTRMKDFDKKHGITPNFEEDD